jgi:hypothetical protein
VKEKAVKELRIEMDQQKGTLMVINGAKCETSIFNIYDLMVVFRNEK